MENLLFIGANDQWINLLNINEVSTLYMGHSEYKHTIKYLKFIDAQQRLGLVNFIGTHRNQK
jgi:hypothetical protein